MSGQRKKPSGPPPSAGVLARYVQAYASEVGIAEGRVRAWLAYMVLAGMLERSVGESEEFQFTIKGGVALELRLKDRARATKDIDLILHDSVADLAGALERAIEPVLGALPGAEHSTYQGFEFRRKKEPLTLENGTVNVELAVTYRGGAWTSISVDLARAEPGESEIELLDAVQFEDALGVTGPARLPCLPLRYHIAQKIHGMTLPPRAGKRNERFRDLIDLMLIEEMVSDYSGLREACEQVFKTRNQHEWPPPLDLPDHWREGYAKLAKELDLPVVEVEDAMTRVQAMVMRIQAAP